MTDQAISAGRDGARRLKRPAKRRVPPRFAIRSSMWLRRSLLRAADRALPAQVALLEHVHQFVATHLLAAFAELGVADHLAGGPKTADDLAIWRSGDLAALRRRRTPPGVAGCGSLQPGSNRQEWPVPHNPTHETDGFD